MLLMTSTLRWSTAIFAWLHHTYPKNIDQYCGWLYYTINIVGDQYCGWLYYTILYIYHIIPYIILFCVLDTQVSTAPSTAKQLHVQRKSALQDFVVDLGGQMWSQSVSWPLAPSWREI
jgi:hypothetical protein